jgi:hypothetical protein
MYRELPAEVLRLWAFLHRHAPVLEQLVAATPTYEGDDYNRFKVVISKVVTSKGDKNEWLE